MSFSETIFLFFLALLVFGPKKLPEIARTVGKYLAEFRRASNEFKSQIEQEIANIEREENYKKHQAAKAELMVKTEPPVGTASRTLEAPAEEPATLAAPTPETVPTAADQGATEAVPATETVITSTSQETHA